MTARTVLLVVALVGIGLWLFAPDRLTQPVATGAITRRFDDFAASMAYGSNVRTVVLLALLGVLLLIWAARRPR